VVAGVTALVFARSLGHGFVAWDDEILVRDNPAFRGFGWTQIRWMASNVLLGHYVPITWLSFAIDHAIWGLRPVGFHLTNVLLHALNAALVCVLAGRLVAAGSGWGSAVCRVSGIATALLWALHPLRVEAVSWVTGRRDVLSACFLFVALLAYLKAMETASRRRAAWLVAAVLAHGLALGSKAVVMVLPIVLLALEVYPFRGLSADPRRWADRAHRAVWARLAPFAALAIPGAVASYVGQGRGSGMVFLAPDRWLDKVVTSLGFHLERTLVPIGLSPLYELPRVSDFPALRHWTLAFVVVCITGAVLMLRRRWPAGLTGWVWYVAFLAPVMAVAHVGPQITADRYSYLPILGPLALVGTGAGALTVAARAGRAPPGLFRAVGIGGLLVLVGLSALTWRQQGIWRDTGRLWAHAVAATPWCVRCHVSLANWLADEGQPAAAIAHYEHALALDPMRGDLHINVGLALMRMGRPVAAIAHYEAALAQLPDRVAARVSLATALVAAGRLAEAVARLDEAARFASPGALVDYFQQVTTAQPAAPVPRLGLYQAYARVEDRARAHEAYAALAALHPALARHARPSPAVAAPRP
jgi:Tfp pilus assembly protein PilF